MFSCVCVQHLSIRQLVRLRALLDAGGMLDEQEDVDPVVARALAAELAYRKKVCLKVGVPMARFVRRQCLSVPNVLHRQGPTYLHEERACRRHGQLKLSRKHRALFSF